jgi:rubrerythrin
MKVSDKERKEKERGVLLLREQMKVEGKLVGLYEKTASDIKSKPVRHLLHMIQLDSRKHIDICETAIEILMGEDVLKEEKQELLEGLRAHIELERGAIERANEILKNTWIKENKALTALFKKLRDDERRHHQMLKNLTDQTFFRQDPRDLAYVFRDTGFLEARYRRSRDFWRKREKKDAI